MRLTMFSMLFAVNRMHKLRQIKGGLSLLVQSSNNNNNNGVQYEYKRKDSETL